MQATATRTVVQISLATVSGREVLTTGMNGKAVRVLSGAALREIVFRKNQGQATMNPASGFVTVQGTAADYRFHADTWPAIQRAYARLFPAREEETAAEPVA